MLAASVTQQATDVQQFVPMTAQTASSLDAAGIGQRPDAVLADAGYCSEANLQTAENLGGLVLIATGRQRHGETFPTAPAAEPVPKDASRREQMAHALRTEQGRANYARRKAIVEPVFGQMKTRQNAGHLRLRGLAGASQHFPVRQQSDSDPRTQPWERRPRGDTSQPVQDAAVWILVGFLIHQGPGLARPGGKLAREAGFGRRRGCPLRQPGQAPSRDRFEDSQEHVQASVQEAVRERHLVELPETLEVLPLVGVRDLGCSLPFHACDCGESLGQLRVHIACALRARGEPRMRHRRADRDAELLVGFGGRLVVDRCCRPVLLVKVEPGEPVESVRDPR